MSKKALAKWSVWMGVFTFIYCFIYVLISPLYKQGLMWMTFVALPIYLNGGAEKKEYPNYVTSMLCGILWGLLMVWLLGLLSSMYEPLAMGLVCGGVTIICCLVHFILTPNLWCNKIPMMFGAISMTFSQGGKNIPFIIITLLGGLTLGMICGLGPGLIEKYEKKK